MPKRSLPLCALCASVVKKSVGKKTTETQRIQRNSVLILLFIVLGASLCRECIPEPLCWSCIQNLEEDRSAPSRTGKTVFAIFGSCLHDTRQEERRKQREARGRRIDIKRGAEGSDSQQRRKGFWIVSCRCRTKEIVEDLMADQRKAEREVRKVRKERLEGRWGSI